MGKIDIQAAVREEMNKYQRKWRAANREKVKSYNRSFWERKALQHIQNTNTTKGDDIS